MQVISLCSDAAKLSDEADAASSSRSDGCF